MQGRLFLGWGLVIPGCFGTLALSQGATLDARSIHEPHPRKQSADDGRVPTPCRAVSTRGYAVFYRRVVRYVNVWWGF